MSYTIQQVSQLTGVSAYSIRYYDSRELIPGIQRDENNVRQFDEESVDVVRLITCFRKTGMPLKAIKHYIDLIPGGDATLQERFEIMAQHKADILDETTVLNNNLKIVQSKLNTYQTTLAALTVKAN
ncbi:MerR family transcriptional regulator [Lactobacillus sp. CBA3605]|uniref:MerR family transcriptional regulator n=1 Tax=Lactobacillus sp. CBA3605 TaxID=2099788 RepID=UPI000CFC9C58|nr:MerR family transcriptional regulator [Lactobacillus sp. CBA3605]AVK61184.1 MerR family transcriptional regulator [Lactobacillus sp. CBA3605]